MESFEVNSAVTDALIGSAGQGAANTVRIFQHKGQIVTLGRYQNKENEVRGSYCRQNQIMIRQRLLPGDAVLSGEADTWWEFIAAKQDFAHGGELCGRVIKSMIAAFARKGLAVEVRDGKLYLQAKIIGYIFANELGSCWIVQGVFVWAFSALDYTCSLKIPTEKVSQKSISKLNESFGGLSDSVTKQQVDALVLDFASSAVPCGAALPAEACAEYRDGKRMAALRENAAWTTRRELQPSGHTVNLVSSSIKRNNLHMEAVALIDNKTRKIQDFRLYGNFDCTPADSIQELESRIAAAKPPLHALHAFFSQPDQKKHRLHGIPPDYIERLIVDAGRKIDYHDMLAGRINEISLVGAVGEAHCFNWKTADLSEGALLLPYCSKLPGCLYRKREGCSRCGRCGIGAACSLADAWGLKTQTVQNYEMLEAFLQTYKRTGMKFFIGICCPPFIAKHYDDFNRIGLPGLLIHLNNTTCYDIGREDIAHAGHYENQTFLDLALLHKIIASLLHGRNRSINSEFDKKIQELDNQLVENAKRA